MALEDRAAEQFDELIPGISFKLPNAANYVYQRTFSTFYPQGSNFYSPTGTRLIRLVISDQNFLDLSTVRLAFQIVNQSATSELWLTGHPGQSIFQRVRMYVGGCLVEDILLANRVGGMLDRLKPANRRWSESLEMFSQESEWSYPGDTDAGFVRGPFAKMAAGQTRTIITPILSGLLASHYWLPVKFAPLTIELELVNSAGQCCATTDPDHTPPLTLSQGFHLQNVRLLGDVCTVDSAVTEQLSKVLLEGGALPMHFTSYSTTLHSLALTGLANQNWSVVLARAFSRIKSIFVTFDSDGSHGAFGTESSNFLNWHGKASWDQYGARNPYAPLGGEGWRFQFSTGALLVPQMPMSSAQEAFYQLSKLLGMHSSLEGVSIPPGEWLASSFIIGLDMEKANSSPGSGMAAFSGMSTRNAGDTMRFAFDSVNCRDAASAPQRMYITLHMDLICEIRQEGCVLLD